VKIPPRLRAWITDVAERVTASFGEAVVAAVAAGALAKGVNATTTHVLLVAGLTAAAATLKGILAGLVKGTMSPASLAPALISKRRTTGVQAERGERQNRRSEASYNIAQAAIAVPVRTVVLPEKPSKNGGRLGRHVHHDERSRAYRVTPHPAPKSVTWKRHVKPFDQGDLGSCTGNAMAGALSTAPFTHRFTERRAVTLYEQATALDDVPGQYPPDDTGSSGLAVAKAAQSDGLIATYLHCFSLADVISALQDGPCIAGTNWYTGMDTPYADGIVHATGTVRGGHEYELVGVDLDSEYFLACNSWGTSWGPLGGYFKIPFADFTRLLAEQGDVTVPVRAA